MWGFVEVGLLEAPATEVERERLARPRPSPEASRRNFHLLQPARVCRQLGRLHGFEDIALRGADIGS